MEETTQVQEQQVEVKKRPAFLTVLCILTFIGSGLVLLGGLLVILAGAALSEFFASIPGMTQATGNIMPLIISVVFSAVSLFGAIMMWQLKKLGFYIYVAAQVIMVAFSFSVMGLIFTLLFIVLYFLNFKHMK